MNEMDSKGAIPSPLYTYITCSDSCGDGDMPQSVKQSRSAIASGLK
jgi:hypothetical protein